MIATDADAFLEILLDGGVVIHGALDYVKMSEDLESPKSILFRNVMAFAHAKMLRKQLEHLRHAVPDAEQRLLSWPASFKAWWQHFWLPASGLKHLDVDGLFRLYSLRTHLKNIQKPLLVVHAVNDPVTPGAFMLNCPDEVTCNPNVIMALTKSGGHCGMADVGSFLSIFS